MAAQSGDFTVNEDGVLTSVSKDYVEKHGGVFTIPDWVIAIGERSFSSCTNLNQLIFADSFTDILSLVHINNLENLEITIIASEPSEEKAHDLKNQLQEDYPNIAINIELSASLNIKGDSSSPSFFSTSKKRKQPDEATLSSKRRKIEQEKPSQHEVEISTKPNP